MSAWIGSSKIRCNRKKTEVDKNWTSITVGIKKFIVPSHCCRGSTTPSLLTATCACGWSWDMNQGQWAWRKALVSSWYWLQERSHGVSRTPCRNKSVLHHREASKGANDAVEERVSRTMESDRAVLHCSPVLFQEVYEPRWAITQIFCVLHSYSAFKLEAVCRGGCGLLVVFKLLFIISVAGPFTSLYLHRYVSECWCLYSDLKWKTAWLLLSYVLYYRKPKHT